MMIMIQKDLVDNNLYSVIKTCSIHKKSPGILEILVTYENGDKERIWTFDSGKHSFDYREFIGKTKIEAVFYCDRKRPRTI